MSKERPYVVYAVERLRDGTEESVKVVFGLEAALVLIQKWSEGFVGCNTDFRLFELGKEILLETVKEETPQPPVVRKKFKVKK